jgi:Tol biopolymer transport system component
MKTFVRGLMTVALLASAPSLATAATPANGGAVGGTITVINNSAGDQDDPHVSGDLVTYTERSATASTVRYYHFSTRIDQAIPKPPDADDSLPDVSGNNIVFTRRSAGCNAIMVLDATATPPTPAEVAPTACPQRVGTAIGNTTVAYIDFASGSGVTFAADLAGGDPVQLSSGAGTTQNPAVDPSGNAVVWEQCASSIINCDIMRAVRTGGGWGAAQPVANPATPEANPDTDGTWVVYDADRAGSFTGHDIYFRPLAGGDETQLQIAGFQTNPSISHGVIAFESRITAGAPADIFVYVIATNTLYQVTTEATIDHQLSDVSVLPNGDVRVVWSANDGVAGDYNVYARTFTVPLGLGNPAEMIADLIDKTLAFADRAPLAAQLRSRLEHIASAVIANNMNLACGLLNLYIAAVRAAPSSVFTQPEKDALRADANAIKARIGCR